MRTRCAGGGQPLHVRPEVAAQLHVDPAVGSSRKSTGDRAPAPWRSAGAASFRRTGCGVGVPLVAQSEVPRIASIGHRRAARRSSRLEPQRLLDGEEGSKLSPADQPDGSAGEAVVADDVVAEHFHVPSVASAVPATRLINVVFPAPLGPAGQRPRRIGCPDRDGRARSRCVALGCATKSNRRLRHTPQDATGAVPVRGGTFWNRIGRDWKGTTHGSPVHRQSPSIRPKRRSSS